MIVRIMIQNKARKQWPVLPTLQMKTDQSTFDHPGYQQSDDQKPTSWHCANYGCYKRYNGRQLLPKPLESSKTHCDMQSNEAKEYSKQLQTSQLNLNKAAESAVHNHLLEFTEDRNIIPQHQFSFRNSHFTVQQMLQLTDAIIDNVNISTSTTAIFLVVQRTLYKVSRYILIHKMHTVFQNGH